MKKAVIVEDVSKKYKLYENSKERILDLFRPDRYGKSFYALSDVNFEANTGEVVGFIGTNGSGKSTLSNIIAGIVPESTGTVQTNGDVSLIAVAAGLKNDLSGRDNIELKLLMLGFNKQEIEALEPSIIEFAELEQFIDQPVKSYSSGMRSRLGFAISVSVNPEILIIDEALSVGDKAFAEKSLNKMKEFKKEGKTMIFVSHSIGQMKKFCDKILWLEFGRVKEYGAVEEVIPKYEAFLESWKKMSKQERARYKTKINNDEVEKAAVLIKEKNITEAKKKNIYKERPTSQLGKFRGNPSYIFDSVKAPYKQQSSQKFKGLVYYIKKRADYHNERYYLISTEPSAQRGVIGWVKQNDIKVRQHRTNDEDNKVFIVNGIGRSYNEPWGDQENIVLVDLSLYKDEVFQVSRTDRVGRALWYFGNLKGKQMWIREKHLSLLNNEI